jgi:hypothetical protein
MFSFLQVFYQNSVSIFSPPYVLEAAPITSVLCNFISNSLNLYYSRHVVDKVSHPHKATGKVSYHERQNATGRVAARDDHVASSL